MEITTPMILSNMFLIARGMSMKLISCNIYPPIVRVSVLSHLMSKKSPSIGTIALNKVQPIAIKM